METIFRHLEHGLRSLKRSWGFTALVVLSLGLGLGANTAIFSLVDTLLLRSLPVSEPDRLVIVRQTTNGKRIGVSPASMDTLRSLTSIYAAAGFSTSDAGSSRFDRWRA
jgi:hypothetical protein